jgi:mannuronan 5-epimerase
MQKSYTFWLSKNYRFFFTVVVLVVPLLWISLSEFGASAACITYSSSSRSITVTCTSTTHLTTVNSAINNVNVLKKESTGVWLLSANLVVSKGANLVIDSTDGTWLKIRSDGSTAYGLKNSGTLTINSVKITSWNTASNNYASAGSGSTPRAYIVSSSGGTGKTNILNSEIAYLGYSTSGSHGLDYYGGGGSLIQNNNIHHLWRAFYSSGVGGITFTKNVVHDSMEYGIDPHSGTHDMYITYNKVYNNNHGVICSVACYNMHITNNELYNNQRDGIFMDAGSHHSTIANNIIHDEDVAIQLPSLSYSEVYGNTITNSKYGIEFETQIGSVFDRDGRCVPYGCVSINNSVHNNNIKATSIGLWAKDGASSNTFAANTINGANGDRGIVVDGSKTSNNIFKDNHISNAKYSVRVTGGNTNTKFINNYLDTVAPSGEYTLATSSALKLESTKFSSDVIRGLDSSSIPVSVTKSGIISVKDGTTTKTYNTDTQAYSKTLTNNAKIIVTSSSTSAASTASALAIDTATAAVLNDNSSNHTLDENSTSNKANPMQQQSAERQANLAQQQAQQQLDDNLKIDNSQLTQVTNKSTEAQSQNDGQGAKPDKIKLSDPNVSGKQVTRNERTDNMQSENSHKDTDRTSKLSSSINDGQRLNHETVLSFKVTKGSSNGKYLLTGNLRDKNTGSPLQGMKVFFTADSPIKISNQTTNKAGSFGTNALIEPGTGGTFKIQAHFDKLNHHDATDSKTIILKIRAEKPSTPLEDHGSRNLAISRHATPNQVDTKTNDTSEAIH